MGIKKKIVLILSMLTLIFLYGCGSSERAESPSHNKSQDFAAVGYNEKSEEDSSPEEAILNGADMINSQFTSQKIIYTAEISVETEAFDKAVESIRNKTNEVKGYIENSSVRGKGSEENDPKHGYFILRIPRKEFEYIKKSAESWGSIIQSNSSAQDVTESYIDTETRLQTLQIQQDRIMELLKKADKMEDIITLEQELQSIRYKIETYTSSLRKMDSLVDYSTISINLYEVKKVTVVPKGFSQEIGKATKSSWNMFGEFIKGAIVIIIYALPYILILGIIVVIIARKRGNIIKKLPFMRKNKE